MTVTRYKAYIFDLYGTLADIRTDENSTALWRRLARFYAKRGAVYNARELKRAYTVITSELERLGRENCEINIGEVFTRLYRAKKVFPDEELIVRTAGFFRKCSTEYLRLYENVPLMLDTLRGSGARVFLLTNAQRLFTAPELKALGIEKSFDNIYISSDFGVKKPDRRFFDALLKNERLSPGECLMTGNDRRADIAGAKAAGMSAFYIHSDISPKNEPDIPADMELDAPDMKRAMTMLVSGECRNEDFDND